ncbi:aminotransferase class V-fold PLP-dependent enzyme [Nonomuraea helvata]|uniref:Aminotransferase class V-fold PLP-dependent enzyme n=1 Tax=Nonomuraea helvata TaxID=37484 RepID=A0ABV5SE05_9ACTN
MLTGDTRYNRLPARVAVPLFPFPAPGAAFFRWLGAPADAVRAARIRIAGLLGVPADRITLTSSGTAALRLALTALRRHDTDEVILPSFGCPSLVEAVLNARMRPVFADITADFTLDPADVARRIRAATRVILAPHTFGTPCALDALLPLAEAHGIDVLDDAAQSLATAVSGRMLGTHGTAGVLSFGRHKTLFAGGGGALVWNGAPERRPRPQDGPARPGRTIRALARCHLSDLVRALHTDLARHALLAPAPFSDAAEALERHVVEAGPAAAFDGVRAALLLDQLPRLARYRRVQERHLRRYSLALAGQTSIALPPAPVRAGGMAFLPLRCPPGRRHAISAVLAARGVESTWLYYPLHLLRRYRGIDPGAVLPRTESLWTSTLCVPSRGWHGERQIERAAAAVAEAGDST